MYRLITNNPLILASASPRRQEMLRRMGIFFECLPADVDETLLPQEGALAAACRLARLKALAISQNHPKRNILAADTLVALGDEILGKPKDADQAIEMIQTLSGHEHQVITGFCLVNSQGNHSGSAVSRVKFRRLCQAEIEAYVKSMEPMGKAGAYAIQGLGAALVEGVSGSYTNVVGLPLAAVVALLLEKNIIEPAI
jgi:septum formation protein